MTTPPKNWERRLVLKLKCKLSSPNWRYLGVMILKKKTLIIGIHKITLSVLSIRQQFLHFKINYIFARMSFIRLKTYILYLPTYLNVDREVLFIEVSGEYFFILQSLTTSKKSKNLLDWKLPGLTNYEQLFRAVFFLNIIASALKSCIKWS